MRKRFQHVSSSPWHGGEDTLLRAGNLHLANHRLLQAECCYRQAIDLNSILPEAHNNLGTVLKEQGLIEEATACFERALSLRPFYASAHSNLLFTQHYASGRTPGGLRLSHELWAKTHLYGLKPLADVPLRHRGDGTFITVGLLSPDLYAHPVGVFLLPWLRHHDRNHFRLICYSDSDRDDGMTHQLKSQTPIWRSVVGQSDEALAAQIVSDCVDILIDLAGHTAGNRLRLFARRAAPVQVTWLGYSSTTGVPAMDYILMDAYSAPVGYEIFFTEKLLRLDGLRFCYSPPGYAPEVSASPCTQNRCVTFGSFNNLAKMTPEVIVAWAKILHHVEGSRLVLKWKSLAEPAMQVRIREAFAVHDIAAERIVFRGWSRHPAMLAEYCDIDICLDPFPFSGGLTTCDALYMGVPVVTLAGELPIARQTGSFLDAMGLNELIADSREEYIAKAIALAQDTARLNDLRQTMRGRMVASRLCDGPAYARTIENALAKMIGPGEDPLQISSRKDVDMKTFLHVGCGPKRKDVTTPGFNTPEWREQRLDIDEGVRPDIVGTMLDMSAVAGGSMDAVYSIHNIEHLYPHEVELALKEFRRVLKPDGFLVLTCPDLQSVCALVAQDKLTEPAYTAQAGPIAPLDILYGHRSHLAAGNLFMAHRCGFTQRVLIGSLQAAGFAMVAAKRREHPNYDLWAVATAQSMPEAELRAVAREHLPQ